MLSSFPVPADWVCLDWQLTPQLLAPLVCLELLHTQTFSLLHNVRTWSHPLSITRLENKQSSHHAFHLEHQVNADLGALSPESLH